jgi:hypothetical protein
MVKLNTLLETAALLPELLEPAVAESGTDGTERENVR